MSCPHLTLPGDMQCETCQLRADLAAQKELADVAVAEANASEAECITLRAALATVTVERDALRVLNKNNDMVSDRAFKAERSAHAETRKALEELRAKMLQVSGDSVSAVLALESTRAELERIEDAGIAEANRLRSELESVRQKYQDAHRTVSTANEASAKAEAALEEARAEITAADRNGVEIGLRLAKAEARVKRAIEIIECLPPAPCCKMCLEALRG